LSARDPVLFPELSEREREVLELVARGLSNGENARRLVVSPKTVRNHVSNVFTKLQVADRSEAIVRARRAGLGREEA
jgi:DNA-binding NarL/FixJ family response regulator